MPGDVETLQALYGRGQHESLGARKAKLNLRCSAMFKLTADDVLFGHATWDHFGGGVRLFLD